jgi:class 3 adenylate cyclase
MKPVPLPIEQSDDRTALAEYLPRLLRHPAITAVLLPPRDIEARDRAAYSPRMTTALLSAVLFVSQAVMGCIIGQPAMAMVALAGVVTTIASALGVRIGKPRAALLLGWISAFGYLAYVHTTFGAEVLAWVFIFPIGMVAVFVHRQEEWLLRMIPVSGCLVGLALVVVPGDEPVPNRLGAVEQQAMIILNGGASLYACLVLAGHFAVFREASERRIAAERTRADALLLNVLPRPVAARLLAGPVTIADPFDDVSVLFADIVGFTRLSSSLTSSQLVVMLNELFREFDDLADRYGLEKIKTIGDAYMVVGGLPEPSLNHAEAIVRMGLGMQGVVAAFAARTGRDLALRVGIHSGPVTAGVIGARKFAYDLWGDTVNIASRMESNGQAGRIHVSRAVVDRLAGTFSFTDRREIDVKGKGMMETWFVANGDTEPGDFKP